MSKQSRINRQVFDQILDDRDSNFDPKTSSELSVQHKGILEV